MRDFSHATVSITPAEYGSWADARDDLITEEKRPLRAQMEAEISDAGGDAAKITKIRNNFASQERMLESEIDHKPLEMHLSLGISYNVSAAISPTLSLTHTHAASLRPSPSSLMRGSSSPSRRPAECTATPTHTHTRLEG